MNPGKATSYYQGRTGAHGYLKPAEMGHVIDNSADGRASEFARESSARKDRLAQNVRIKLMKVLTLTLLRELEGAGIEPVRSATNEFDLQSEVQHFEAELIRSALIMTGGRQRRAAKLLGMKVTTLHSKIRRYGLNETGSGGASDAREEPSIAEAVRTSLELVEAVLDAGDKGPPESSPEIHVTGSN